MHSRLPKAGTAVGVVAGLIVSSLSIAPAATAAEEETTGNKLSFPVLWSEEIYQLTPPGEEGKVVAEVFDDCDPTELGRPAEAAVQKAPEGSVKQNLWQAENMVAEGNSVTSLDWGDNIEVKDWTVGSPVRIETALYALLGSELNAGFGVETMTGYEMCYVEGSGPSENWGAILDTGNSLKEYESLEAMVYTAGARLTIQRIDAGATPTWDATQKRWVGSGVADPVFNGAIHEKTSDGPGTYGAEINVSGKLIYGFNWQTDGLFNGEYRITFSLDGAADTLVGGTGTSLANAEIRQSVEEPAAADMTIRSLAMVGPGGGGGGGGGEGGGNTAVLLGDQNLSYIDVALSGGEDPPVVPDPDPTTPPAPPSGGGGTTAPPADSGGAGAGGAPGASGAGQPGAGVPVEIASPVQAQQRIRQRARITAPKSSRQRVGTQLMLTSGPVFTDQGVTVRWRITERSQDNCTLRNRNGRVMVTFTDPGRCTVVAWAPSPNPEVFLPFSERRIYKVRNTV